MKSKNRWLSEYLLDLAKRVVHTERRVKAVEEYLARDAAEKMRAEQPERKLCFIKGNWDSQCSECGSVIREYDSSYNYCPHCGAQIMHSAEEIVR